jgi:hypothetical protein
LCREWIVLVHGSVFVAGRNEEVQSSGKHERTGRFPENLEGKQFECFPYLLCQKVKAFTLQSFIKHNHGVQIRDIFPLSGNSTDNFQPNRRQHSILALFLLFDEMARTERCVRVREFPHGDFPRLCLQSRIRNLVLLIASTAAQQMALQTYP